MHLVMHINGQYFRYQSEKVELTISSWFEKIVEDYAILYEFRYIKISPFGIANISETHIAEGDSSFRTIFRDEPIEPWRERVYPFLVNDFVGGRDVLHTVDWRNTGHIG